jgi:hypothetical protein
MAIRLAGDTATNAEISIKGSEDGSNLTLIQKYPLGLSIKARSVLGGYDEGRSRIV